MNAVFYTFKDDIQKCIACVIISAAYEENCIINIVNIEKVKL